jgi:hypothetical protein
VLTAHSLGRINAAMSDWHTGESAAADSGEDFLSGRSGLVAGRIAAVLGLRDRLIDLTSRRRSTSPTGPAREVLVLSVELSGAPSILDPAISELKQSRHRLTIARATAGGNGRGKFQHLNALLAAENVTAFDWVLVIDDDVELPRGFLDTFLAAAEQGGLDLAQPAHRLRSHAAWPVTRRRRGSDWRETTFVEIGPVTAFSKRAAAELLPFPDGLKMGWGLDVHWSAIAAENGWRIGVVDATPITHLIRPTAASYPRDAATEEARRFLAGRPYTRRGLVRTLSSHRFKD